MKIVFISKDTFHYDTLTPGKVYDGIIVDDDYGSSTGFYYEVVNDLGNKRQYYYGHFMTLEKWRQNQLEELGIV